MTGQNDKKIDDEANTSNMRLKEAFEAIDYLLSRFWIERFSYLACALVAVGLLAWTVVLQVQNGGFDNGDWGILFGSSGVFGLTSLGVLFVFRRAHKIIEDALKGGGE